MYKATILSTFYELGMTFHILAKTVFSLTLGKTCRFEIRIIKKSFGD
jgi:hypothetical protein